MDEKIIRTFDASLRRCDASPDFLDRFYERFLSSSPKVQEKFARTNFERQKRLLRASFYLILLAAEDPDSDPGVYLEKMAIRHSAADLDVGAELYDLWLDSLLAVVEECDPAFDSEVEEAWDRMMGIGISYMLRRYHRGA
jgi:hemoglobin-like flavoprotein